MFEEALRNKYRFPTPVGNLDVEDLFDLKLEVLDATFKVLNGKLKQSEEESLLAETTEANKEVRNKIDIVKYIVLSKQEDAKERLREVERAEKKQKILGILKEKQDAGLKEMSEEELQKILADL